MGEAGLCAVDAVRLHDVLPLVDHGARLEQPGFLLHRELTEEAGLVRLLGLSMQTPDSSGILRFSDFELDVAAYALRRQGRQVKLERQPMDVLILLVERRPQLVSRADIVNRLWSGKVFVDVETGVNTAISKVRQALRDMSDAPTFVETVPGRGYRFIAAVEVAFVEPTPNRASAAAREVLPEPPRHNLPSELTSFIGRRIELEKLPGALASSRLVSLTGSGGVGKTRLALRLAADLVQAFADGVWLVDLASLTSPDLVAQTIAGVLGVREGPQRSLLDALVDHLRHRQLLLVLDNCEHLIDTCATLVEVFLRGAPALRILATSREALGVPGETVCRVPSLSLPQEVPVPGAQALLDCEATRLFIERAVAIDAGFAVTPGNGATISDICRRLDGIPLAIELAAARVEVLPVEEINTRLQDRFRLLTGGRRTAVARQRTLEATVDWSYQLLSGVERQLLGRLSVFSAGWTLDAAEKICGGDGIPASDMLELLSRLVTKSLVAVVDDVVDEWRYRLIETVRQYALERLTHTGDADRLRDRHFEFFLNEFRGATPILRGGGQVACLRRLRREQDNVRVALDWGLASPRLSEVALELAGALFWFWTKRGQFAEGRQWLERALANGADAPGPTRARALIGLVHMHYFQGHYAEAGARIAEALSLGREHRDAWVASFALSLQGFIAFELGDLELAATCAHEAREAAYSSGDPVQHGGPLLVLANIAVSTGDHDRAQQFYDESIEVHRRAGDAWGLGILLSAAAGLRIIRGDLEQARAHASEALSLCQELDDARGLAWSLEVFAGLLAARGFGEGAARLWGASDGLLESVGGSLAPTIRWIRDRYIQSVRTSLGDEPFETACAEGRATPPVHVVALACQQTLLLR